MKAIQLLFLVILFISFSFIAQGQYGVGEEVSVPYVSPGTLYLDGNADEAAWNSAPTLDMTAHWDGAWSGHPDADISAEAKLLWTYDTLFVYVKIEDYQAFYWSEDAPHTGEQILVGVDGTHAGDDQIDDSWAGWPWNAPDLGPVAYKIWRDGITMNWGYDGVEPVDSGWVRGAVFVDDDNYEWGVEMAIYLPQISEAGDMIGFNIGGAAASEARAAEEGDGTYAYYSWQSVQNPGGDVMNNSASFATLKMAAADGVVAELEVPYVAPGTLTLDGNADEAAWATAPTVNMIANWDGAWSGHPDPDVAAEAKLLWTEDTLFVYAIIEDYQPFYWNEDAPHTGDQILVGVDGTNSEEGQIDDSWAGWPWNAPDQGPVAYKVWRDGITMNWGYEGVEPVDSGWVRGTVFVNDDMFEWGVEMAIYLPQISGAGSMIGFNIGGAAASEDRAVAEGDGTYAYYSWQSVQNPGGDVMNNSASFATLVMVDEATSVDRIDDHLLPDDYRLSQNYPNPFNPVTNIQYSLPSSGHVKLSVYNMVGQEVAVLVDSHQGAGRYEATWNALDASSGVYFYRLTVDHRLVETKRMILLK